MPARNELNGLIPFQSLFQPAFSSMDNVLLAYEPMMRGMVRCQLEAMGLASRRAQAYMELPSRLSQCRTPHDLMNEQNRFWQNAFQQYTDSSRRMLSAWNQALALPPPFGPVDAEPKQARPRDMIAVPEAKSTPAAGSRPRAVGERRVA